MLRAIDESLRGESRTHVAARQALESFLERAGQIAKTGSFPEGCSLGRQTFDEEDRRFKRWEMKE